MSLKPQTITFWYLVVGGPGGSRDSGTGGGFAGQAFEGTISLALGQPYTVIAGSNGASGWSGGNSGGGGATKLLDQFGNVLLSAAGGIGNTTSGAGSGAGGPASGSSGGPGYCSNITGSYVEYAQGGGLSGTTPVKSALGQAMGAPNTATYPCALTSGSCSTGSPSTNCYASSCGMLFLRYAAPASRLTVLSSSCARGLNTDPSTEATGMWGAWTHTITNAPGQFYHLFRPDDSGNGNAAANEACGDATFVIRFD